MKMLIAVIAIVLCAAFTKKPGELQKDLGTTGVMATTKGDSLFVPYIMRTQDAGQKTN